jgi:hypothetical protein
MDHIVAVELPGPGIGDERLMNDSIAASRSSTGPDRMSPLLNAGRPGRPMVVIIEPSAV